MEIRQIRAEENPTTSGPLRAYAFEQSPAPHSVAEEFQRQLGYRSGNTTLIAEEGGTTLATVSGIPMRQNVRGVVYPMAGIAGVATDPLARRQGHVRRLMHQLLGQLRDEGHPVSALYPFRPSFYARFGYIGLPAAKVVKVRPQDLSALLSPQLPGEVRWQRIGAGYEDYRTVLDRQLTRQHGFSVFPDYRAVSVRDLDQRWLVTARIDGELVAAALYRIEDHGADLVADNLLHSGPLSRALLLQFFARHVDQVAQLRLLVAPDERPELWTTDFAGKIEKTVDFPDSACPMVRVLSLDALDGLSVGDGRVTVDVVDDPFVSGEFLLESDAGTLRVTRGSGSGPRATLTSAGLSALVYGVLDPEEVVIRGLGGIPPEAATPLRALFPPRSAYLHADF